MKRKFLVLLETGLVLAGLLLGASAWKLNSALDQPLNLTQEQLLDVPPGATPTGTFNRLEAEGTLDDAFWLRLYWRFNLEGQPLHSGEYRMTPGMTAQDLIGVWQRGEVVQYSLTLVEGWNFRQVRSALAKHEKIEQTLDGLSDSEVMANLGTPGISGRPVLSGHLSLRARHDRRATSREVLQPSGESAGTRVGAA